MITSQTAGQCFDDGGDDAVDDYDRGGDDGGDDAVDELDGGGDDGGGGPVS